MTWPENKIELLLRENKLLKETILRLEETISSREDAIRALEQTNNKLIQEINTLQEKLGLNSTNSSLPPSRDLYKIKKKGRQASLRKPGGQPGHSKYSYQPLPAHQVVDCIEKNCTCGHDLLQVDKYIIQQKIEIPPIQPHVTEYRQWYGYCPACKKKRLAPLPVGVNNELLGEHIKAIIACLNGFYLNSKRDVQAILKQVFKVDISLGLVSKTAKRVSKNLVGHYQGLKGQIRSSPYLHIDETTHKDKGKKGWAWIFTNQEASLLHLCRSRGGKVVKQVLGKYQGQVISDRYGVYEQFALEKRQACWAHLQRDFERFAHSKNANLAAAGKRLVEKSKELFAFYRAVNNKEIEDGLFVCKVEEIRKEVKEILEGILEIVDIPQGHRVAKKMLSRYEMFWLFVKDRSIAMTNNLAERQLRKYVIYRKKLFFTWSSWGEKFVERILSLYLTCRLNKDSNPFDQLLHCISTNP